MTNPKKELHIACNYFLRLIKPHVQLSPEQILLFKRVFFDILSKRYVDHWFPGKGITTELQHTIANSPFSLLKQHHIVEVPIDVCKPNIGKILF